MPAEINIKPEIALGIKQSDPMTNLSNMLNTANAMQQFQQIQQTNPIALEKARLELEQAKKVNPLKFRQEEEIVKQAETSTAKGKHELADKRLKSIADSQVSMINNPLVIAAEKDPANANREKLVKLVEKNGRDQAEALGIPKEQADQLLKPYLDMAATSPEQLRGFYKQRHIAGLDEAAKGSALTATGLPVSTGAGGYYVQTGEFGANKPGSIIPGTAYTQQLAPGSREEIVQDAEGKPVVLVRDANGTITGIRNLTNAPVPTAPTPATQVAPVTNVNKPPVQQPQISPNMGKLLFPVRQQGAAQIDVTPQEKKARDEGDLYVSDLDKSKLSLGNQRRTLEDTIKTAKDLEEGVLPTTGVLGAATRKLRDWAGDPTYKELSKNLAGTALKAAEAAGTTNARQDLIQASQGTETYPPQTLIKIARRTYGDLRNIDMQAQGAAKWQQNAGSANMAIFKRKWADNADSRVFELLNMQDEIKGLSGEARNKAIKEMELFIGKNPAKAKELTIKLNNIRKLTENGEL